MQEGRARARRRLAERRCLSTRGKACHPELEGDEMIVGTRDSSLELTGAESYEDVGGSRIGRWITDEDKIQGLNLR